MGLKSSLSCEFLLLVVLVSASGCSEEPINVDVTGRDFYWHFGDLATGGDPSAGISASQHELRVRAGQTVQLRITSDDYIYALRSPELDVLEVAVPEMTHVVSFTPMVPGRYPLEIGQFCGFDFLHDNQIMGYIDVVATD